MHLEQWLADSHAVGAQYGFIPFSLEAKQLFGWQLNVYSRKPSHRVEKRALNSGDLCHLLHNLGPVNFLPFTDNPTESEFNP